MINYLRFITEFWFSSAAKVVEWVSQSLFVKKLLSGGGGTMALTKKGFVMKLKRDDGGGGGFHGEEEELELGLGSVRFTRGLGRKRILISSSVRESLTRSAVEIPITESSPAVKKSSLKRQRNRAIVSSSSSSEKSRLESLPQELLVNIGLVNFLLISFDLIKLNLILTDSSDLWC